MALSHVLLFLTYRCNLRCEFCLSFNRFWRGDPLLSLPLAVEPRLFLKPARDFREMTTTDIVERVFPQCELAGVKTVALSGGEVLSRRDTVPIFEALGRSSMEWCFDSNMMLCDDAIARAIVGSGCSMVFASIDGSREVHNRLRGSPKAFDKTLGGLAKLAEARQALGKPGTPITLNFVLQAGNEAEPSKMVDVALACGASQVTFQLLSERIYAKPFDAATAASSLSLAMRRAAASGIPAAIYPIADPDEESLAAWFSTPRTNEFFSGCSYIHESLRIDPEGNVIPCMEHKLGNILQQELAEIWQGPGYRAFRQHLLNDGPFEPCLRCCNIEAKRRAQITEVLLS